jgi:hypothetical protein
VKYSDALNWDFLCLSVRWYLEVFFGIYFIDSNSLSNSYNTFQLLEFLFRIPSGYGSRALETFMCCQVKVSAMGRSLVQRSPTVCSCVSVQHWVRSSATVTLYTYNDKVEEVWVSNKKGNTWTVVWFPLGLFHRRVWSTFEWRVVESNRSTRTKVCPSATSVLIPPWLPWDLTPVSEVKSQHSTAERINLN